jgi:hypothetical protein
MLDDPRAPMMALELISHRGTHVHRKPVAVLGLAVAGVLAGCSAPDSAQVTIANRSDAVLTIGPGLVIQSCGMTTVSLADYQAVRDKGVQMAIEGETWDAPAGALVWDLPIVNARGTVPAGAITLVVTSTADPAVMSGTVAEDALPPCGGQPLGVEPGYPQGEMPVLTMEPAGS